MSISPHHTSSQNLILDSFSKISLVWLQNKLHPFLMFFQSPTPLDPGGSKEYQPAQEESYFASTTDFHQASLSCTYIVVLIDCLAIEKAFQLYAVEVLWQMVLLEYYTENYKFLKNLKKRKKERKG
jgi:hypothetical protein